MYVTRRQLSGVNCGRDYRLGAATSVVPKALIMEPIKLMPEEPTPEPVQLIETASEANGQMYAGGSATFDESAGGAFLTEADLSPAVPEAFYLQNPGIPRPGETIEQYAFRTGKVAPSSVPLESPVVIPQVTSNQTVVNGTVTYSPVYNIPSKLPYLAGPNMTINSLTKQISSSTATNPEMEFHAQLFGSGLTADQIATVRGNVLALKNIDAMTLQQQKYQQQQRDAYTPPSARIGPTPTSLSTARTAAYAEQQLRDAQFAASTAFYDEARRFRPSELQEQEMAERRGEATANQVTVTDDGVDAATYANGQAVAPPGGVGVPRPGAPAQPGGAAALIPLGILAYLFLM